MLKIRKYTGFQALVVVSLMVSMTSFCQASLDSSQITSI